MTHTFSFLLGRVQNPEHETRLQDIAATLDANKFSCTFSVVEGMALLDVTPYNADLWPSPAEFHLYAAERIIHKLAKSLAAPSAERVV